MSAKPRVAGSPVRTLGMLALLTATLPVDLAVTGAALLRSRRTRSAARPATGPPSTTSGRRTVLISGGKMTKALALARQFHGAGHRVVLIEQEKYRLTAHRFSRAVDRFHTVPVPQHPGYVAAVVDIARREGVDVYVPVCSPVASYCDALAKQALEPWCEVVHADAAMVERLDDKEQFAALAASLGLSTPESYRITSPEQVAGFDFGEAGPGTGREFILKSIAYDPVHRLDLTRLPRPTPEETRRFAESKPMTPDNPWVMQQFVEGQEYCTHSTVRAGRVQVYCCCSSSPFQINYAHVDKPAIERWVTTFVGALGITGQVSFDFIEAVDGQVYAIECNPRTHSAITMFYDHPDVAAAYLQDGHDAVRPTATSRPTYWIYHEVWRLLTRPRQARGRLGTILAGTDAVFDASDPLPFLMLHHVHVHVHVPSLLLQNLRRGAPWLKVDLNIGKLVEPGGD